MTRARTWLVGGQALVMIQQGPIAEANPGFKRISKHRGTSWKIQTMSYSTYNCAIVRAKEDRAHECGEERLVPI